MEALTPVSNSSVCDLADTDRPALLENRETTSAVVIQERQVPLASAETATPAQPVSGQNLKVFGTTFVTIFLAELGDKTQVSTLLMSAESHAPWVIFTGAAAALISTSLLGVLVGRWLSSHLSPQTLDRSAGVLLAVLSVTLFWDILR